jgi:hypothetical protein
MMSWLGTNSGKVIHLDVTDPEQITLDDIATGLSNVCRFNGQIKQFYSVAQHSMYVASLVPDRWKLQALMHDATEAYICDVPTPLKRELGEAYSKYEREIARAIGIKFNLELEHLADVVKQADRIMLVTEHHELQAQPADWGPDYENVLRYPGFAPVVMGTVAAANEFKRRFNIYKDYAR